jgi:hypothetical protein
LLRSHQRFIHWAKSYKEIWSGRRDSNPQPSAWEADALPLRHTRSVEVKKIN